MAQRRRADSKPSEFDELVEELIHLAAAYPWVGFGVAVVLFVVAAVFWRMGSYYPLFGALAGLFAVLFLIAAGIGSGLRIVKGRRGAQANAVPDRLQYRPLLAIELDDASHARPDRVDRDRELEDVLRQAGIRLERFRCEQAYDPRAIRERIDGRESSPRPLISYRSQTTTA